MNYTLDEINEEIEAKQLELDRYYGVAVYGHKIDAEDRMRELEEKKAMLLGERYGNTNYSNPIIIEELREKKRLMREELNELASTEGEALKYDDNKTDWAILPLGAVEEIIKVMKFGEGKYARGNFAASTGLSYTRLLNALARHTFAFMRGEDNDPESGLSHMAHAGCCVLFLLHYIVNSDKYKSNDDRATNILP